MEIGTATDVGRRRTHNEDNLLVVSHPELPRRGVLCAVADGMGGHAAGEVASRIAVDTLAESYFQSEGEPRAALDAAIRSANRAVWQAGNADPGRKGMGTTLVCAAIVDDLATIANVGDSQAYLIDDQGIRLVTQDHSWVAEQVAQGRLSARDAQQHPFRNVLTRSLGVLPEVEADFYQVRMSRGATLLLCSDGLINHVRPEEMRARAMVASAQEAAQQLVELANERGGMDNITVVLVRS